MLVYMINELLVEKKLSIDTVMSYLSTYRGDFCGWYSNLDIIQQGWRKSFFRKYLAQPYDIYVRKVFSELGEQAILNRIAYEIDEDPRVFAASPEARECALGMLVNDLGYMQKYQGSILLRDYIIGMIPETFRDKATIIKQLITTTSSAVEYTERANPDSSLLKTIEPAVVKAIFERLIDVDVILVTGNQDNDYRQFSFLSAYQLWWFNRMVTKLKTRSRNLVFTVHNFNKKIDNREHGFLTEMFDEAMSTIEQIYGTADLRQLIRKLAAKLQRAEGNTGVNIPIKWTDEADAEKAGRAELGIWHCDSLHNQIVVKKKRDNFGVLLDAFIALARLHNILESACVDFPSYYTELSRDRYHLFKFTTLYDYLYHSHKVLSAISNKDLPASLEGLLRPENYEKSAMSCQKEMTRFNEFFSLLAQYVKNILNCPIYEETEWNRAKGREVKTGYKYFLRDAYDALNSGEDPLKYVIADYPDRRLNDFTYRAFEKAVIEHIPEEIPHEYLTIFYKRKPRVEILPLYVRLYNKILDIYNYIVKGVGLTANVTGLTGPVPQLLVTNVEFSIVISEHESFQKLAQLPLEANLAHDEMIIEIAASLMEDKLGARDLVTFMKDVPNAFVDHWSHVIYVLVGLYKVAHSSRDVLFDFSMSERIPPIIPNDKAKRYKMQVDLKQSHLQTQSRLARIEKQGFHKDENGFLRTEHGTYLMHYFGGKAYFAHVDGYYINDALEILILGES